MILLQFRTILFPFKLCVTEKRTNVNKRFNLLNPCLLKVFLSIFFNKLPEVGLIMAITAALVPFPVDRDRLICKSSWKKIWGYNSAAALVRYVLCITLWWNIFWSGILIYMHLRTLQKLFHPVVMYIESLSKYVDNVDRTIGCNTYVLKCHCTKEIEKQIKIK